MSYTPNRTLEALGTSKRKVVVELNELGQFCVKAKPDEPSPGCNFTDVESISEIGRRQTPLLVVPTKRFVPETANERRGPELVKPALTECQLVPLSVDKATLSTQVAAKRHVPFVPLE